MCTKAHKYFALIAMLCIVAGNCYSQSDTGLGRNNPRVHHHLPPLPLFPQFPGGKDSLASFLKKHTHYPDSARKHRISGTVEVDFVVKKDGHLTNIHVYKPLGYGCDKEAVRVVKKMPRWVPSKAGHDTIETDFHVDIPFGETAKK
jgi:TonB family protein